jgi:putative transposase
MLDESELLAWHIRRGSSPGVRSVIANIRESAPARRVGGGRRNVTGRYPSRKMGFTVQFESHRVELAAIYEMEHASDVLEYYDQPPPFKLDYYSARGRHLGVLHTADFFVIRKDGAGWEECKTHDELVRLSAQNENRYRSEDGATWHCPPGESHAASLGLYYRVRSSRDIDWIFQRNAQFLEDYFRSDAVVSSSARETVLAHVNAVPGLALDQLIDCAARAASCDDIYALVAAGEIYINLHETPLTEPAKVSVFANEAVLPGSGSIQQTKLRACVSGPTLRSQAGEVLARASHSDLNVANQRLRYLSQFLQKQTPEGDRPIPLRTLQRWAAAYRNAESNLGSGYLGLLPNVRRGNCSARLPDETCALMAEFITSDYESLKQKTRYASWIAFRLACEKRGLISPSYKTYCLAIRHRQGYEQALKRQGPRAAYVHEPFYWQLEFETPRHGDRPLEIAHIDHTELDVESVSGRTGRGLGRTWITLLSDAYARRILALYLTFDPPSYRSCMMVLRECVRRHRRLPQIVVVDGGREFQSTYFETLLARYEVVKKTRPPAKPRFGSVCERLFGTANTQFVHNLKGNTQLVVKVRQVTQSVNPKGQAVWPFEELYRRLTEYAYEIYDTLSHPALGQSPRQAYESGIAMTGSRPQRQIAYDRDFLVLTLPTTAKGTAKIIPGKGVQVHYLYYWCELFRNPEFEKQNIPVRYDPFDAGTAFAFVDGQWTECHSEHYVVFHGRSEREVMLASQQLRRSRQRHSQEFKVTATRLAEFLQSVEAEERLLDQRMADIESQPVRAASCGPSPGTIPSRSVQEIPKPVAARSQPHLYGEM